MAQPGGLLGVVLIFVKKLLDPFRGIVVLGVPGDLTQTSELDAERSAGRAGNAGIAKCLSVLGPGVAEPMSRQTVRRVKCHVQRIAKLHGLLQQHLFSREIVG
ncbi:hypothetical protein J3459_012457 [Metarhizium acridum]|nr:hypothetical protein J3459_012457 [Metarhizium acridum]